MDHRHHRVRWGGERSRTSASNWQQPRRWNGAAKAGGVRRRVFCASLADVFDNQVPQEWRDDLWTLIAECPALDWLLLTKRPQNVTKMLPNVGTRYLASHDWPWPWVWIGTTAENQIEYQRRWTVLARDVPAAVKFLSIEPQLEPIVTDFSGSIEQPHTRCDWLICGGESGPQARPFDIEWARSLRMQCADQGVAFFMKQVGDNPIGMRPKQHHGADPVEWPADLRVRQFPEPRNIDAMER